jgi:hypothetical protein
VSPQALPALGSMFAYDALVKAFVQWRLKQQACEARPDEALDAAAADEAWALMRRHAENCGYEAPRHGPLSAWAPRTVRRWGTMIGVSELEIGVVLGDQDGVSVRRSEQRVGL